ncbi:SDR family NAD(P)-dependent oxidoreductase, partial [Chitinophaga sp. 22536]|uniref:SDR family NAD(P)-dependent oxidoreductase n=1 Tax=unclassified Chitinophaga TaxID=2619133 RepID=UPI003F83909C
MSWLKDKESSSGKVLCSRDYTLSMPGMVWGGMSENWLLKELGDIHWSMIGDGLGVTSDRLTDSNGERLYASFVRLCWESSQSLGAFRENQHLSVNSELSRFGKKMFFSDAVLTSSECTITASLMSVFSARNTGDNRALKNAVPLVQGDDRIATHDKLPSFARQYFDVKTRLFPQEGQPKDVEFSLAGHPFELDTTPLFNIDYTIDPFDDINGVGLIYFAAFPKISDKCERLYFNQQSAGAKDWAYRSSCLARDIYYFGNANPGEQLEYQLDSCEFITTQLVRLSASLFRKEDKQLIAKIFSVKVVSAGDNEDEAEVTATVDKQSAVDVAYNRKSLSEAIAVFLSSMLGEATLTGSANLRLYGIESVVFLELSAFLQDKFGLKSNPSRFYGHSTIDEIVSYLLNEEQVTGIKTDDRRESRTEDIAIVGTAFRLPGAADWKALWDILANGRSVITNTPSERWRWPSGTDPENTHRGLGRGGYLPDIEKFDATFFRISPREAELMDPQQRLLLELTWELLEKAGYKAGNLKGSRTGVYIGASGSDYELVLQKEKAFESAIATGTALSILANRISYFYDLEGPSLQIDTACSSSLVAIHEAVNAIRSGECMQAIAGGVHLMCHYAKSLSYYEAGMLSPDGKCQTFDEKANGYVRGEGAVLFLLKPLTVALADNDQILGVIKATAVNHGGQSGGLTVPNPHRQQELLKAAYQQAGIDVSTVGYIEAHGTGTSLGDPIEVTGLTTAFNHLQKRHETALPAVAWCGIGSIKTNIGHLEAAAGVAGMLKVLLSMKKQYLPATINFDTLNKKIELEGSPFYVQHIAQPWKPANSSLPLRAGVSSFGIGGVNCHVVLESFTQTETPSAKLVTPCIFVLSAKNKNRLLAYVIDMLAYLQDMPEADPASIAYTMQTAREEMDERLAIVYSSVKELVEKLRCYTGGTVLNGCFTGNVKTDGQLAGAFNKTSSVVQQWITDRNPEQLAKHWCYGTAIDWNLLYGAKKLDRTVLPGYPFARDSYWVSTSEKVESAGAQQLHPLVHNNTSDLNEQRYTSIYTGNEQFLSDHIVDGKKMLPGVAYLEMARTAGLLATGKNASRISEVYWLSPIRVNDAPQAVHVRVYPDRENIGYEVYTNNGTDSIIHARGLLDYREPAACPSPDLIAIRQRLEYSADKDACYRFLRQQGLDYKQGFQGIEQLNYNGTEALAIISLPIEAGYGLPPGLMDGVLQTCLCLNLPLQKADLLLPFSIGEVLIYGDIASQMYCYATKRGGETVYDAVLLTMDGEVRLFFRGVSMLPAKGTVAAKQPVLSSFNKNVHLFDAIWQISSLAESKKQQSVGTHLLLLAGGPLGLDEKLRQTIPEAEVIVTTAVEAEEYFVQVFLEIRKKMEGKAVANVLVLFPEEESLRYRFIGGLLKTASREYPRLKSKTIGVERLSLQDIEELAQLVSCELDTSDAEVRYRGGVREVKQLQELRSSSSSPSPGIGIRADGVYLITGGGGGLGRLLASHITNTPGARVVLCGRSEAPSWVAALPAVSYRRCDVGDAASVASLISWVQDNYGELHGIIHAAGVVRDSFI